MKDKVSTEDGVCIMPYERLTGILGRRVSLSTVSLRELSYISGGSIVKGRRDKDNPLEGESVEVARDGVLHDDFERGRPSCSAPVRVEWRYRKRARMNRRKTIVLLNGCDVDWRGRACGSK